MESDKGHPIPSGNNFTPTRISAHLFAAGWFHALPLSLDTQKVTTSTQLVALVTPELQVAWPAMTALVFGVSVLV